MRGPYCDRFDGRNGDEAIKRAEAQPIAATKRLLTLCQQKQALAERIAKMICDGKIYLLDMEDET
jgi:DeoR/GlpR family transcriptional regulator of sugar metabolism